MAVRDNGLGSVTLVFADTLISGGWLVWEAVHVMEAWLETVAMPSTVAEA